ncbi:MAG: choice-of-anchor J domain-containing protein, partial [Candidatus Cloacimonetes bacterium]|nr:choice-of-anchor J domain-containing protein [Candidatus Cloacimonadota bacterium]
QNFKVYRDDVLLTTTPNSTYTDYAVSNGNSYTYYVVAVYAGGESDPTDSIEVIAGYPTSVIIGSGTAFTTTTDASPISAWYKSRHGQSVYTKLELNALGISGPTIITALGFNIGEAPAVELSNFIIRMKHTNATEVATMQDAANLSTVYSNSAYTPQTGWDMLSLDTPFLWNGTDNILVDTAFGLLSEYNQSGIVQYSSITDGYCYLQNDTTDQRNIFTGGTVSTHRPNVRFYVSQYSDEPQLSLSPSTLDFSGIDAGTYSEMGFSIINLGAGTLVLSSAPEISGDDAYEFLLIDENSYPLSLTFNQSASYTVRYLPSASGQHSAQVNIDYEDGYSLSLSGSAFDLIFGDGFEAYADFSLDLSPWTQYDGDGSTTYGIENVTFTNSGYTGSFIAFNPATTNPAVSTAWMPYSGNKYAAAFAATTPPNNDWLISPALVVGSEASISFWAKSVSDQYGLERFKVLYSTTGNNYTDFTNYLAGSEDTYLEVPTAWTQYEYDLPEECANSTVYIAIQCVSHDAFAFFVDDFKAYSNAQSAPLAIVNPAEFCFEDYYPFYTLEKQFSLTNGGGAILTIPAGGISLEGDSPFSLQNLPTLPVNLENGQSITFTVRFYPNAAGEYGTSLIITDADESTTSVSIFATSSDNLINSFPYMEGFEEATDLWVKWDKDADGYNWERYPNNATIASSGRACMISRSYLNDSKSTLKGESDPDFASPAQAKPNLAHNTEMKSIATQEIIPHIHNTTKGPLTPDNWLISPRIQLGENLRLTWRIAAQDSEWLAENYSVLISNTTPEVDQFESKYTETIADSLWQSRSISLAEYAGDTIYIAFRHHNCTDQFWIKLDSVKILPANAECGDAIVEDTAFNIALPAITDTSRNIPLNVTIGGSGFTNGELIISQVQYANSQLDLPNAGLSVALSGSTFSNREISVVHNLGFVPLQAFWRIIPGGWNILTPDDPSVSLWNSTTLVFTIGMESKADGDFEIVFPQSQDDTLPVTLTGFSAVLAQNGRVKLNWITASETGVLGYLVLRNETEDMQSATVISNMIQATNSSTEQIYEYYDTDTTHETKYYYWLMGRDFNGEEYTFGPVNVFVYGAEDGTGIPAITKNLGNYPNPFNPDTTIRYSIAEPGMVTMTIYNSRGQVVRKYQTNHNKSGLYHWIFDGKDYMGNNLSSGVYFYRFEAGKVQSIHRMMLMK